MPVYLVDQLGGYQNFRDAADYSRWYWEISGGPQYGAVSWNWQSGSTYIYLVVEQTAGWAYNYNCALDNYCPRDNSLVDHVWYSRIRSDPENLGGILGEGRVHVYSHEIGHSLGLFHHGTSCEVLMTNNGCHPDDSVDWPTATDLGNAGCPGSSGEDWGIRCVYDWWSS
jgi:hypothetical protein